MNEAILMLIVIVHFLADFALQTHEQSQLKSTSNKFLAYHVFTYSLVWTIITIPILPNWGFILFGLITFGTHYWIDYCTSRIGKSFWQKQDYHNGFVVVGFDQVLHYLQLYLTFKLLL